ncbi:MULTISPECIES: ABC transporter ATP-binding protein [Halomicrobium]|uniref:ABC transporter related n=2 Tax=Halomicrobium mukohataei TaxID=57705 RepID=C7P0B5_HALMD|nr:MULTISPECIES: ABC transporter ATP-binding protein [Halomicrobium]ACV48907.1 ABC transporter related [Halomicrobium mukohataei DSM 12286]QCD64334.1 ABC transporter ATP-binding protein [Halomicrobium mukohataei]QFR19140.1 ATP-binding cassette domain-containing protein [Halomicrobium sp. ZPS1]
MDEVLVAEDVRRSYGDTVAVDGVSLSLGAGEVFALVGPNGAGKTTLVRALTGTTDAAGRVELFGQSPTAIDRARIGLLPQDFTPHERLTATELVSYYAGLYDDARSVEDVLADVGLEEDSDTWYEELSGGQRRRACVATALINDPDLLVLDEPTTGIDPAGRRSLWRLLSGLADRGVTILVTTHYMEEAHRLADRVGLLADGSLVAVDSPEALVAEYGGQRTLTVGGTFDPSVAQTLDRPVEVGEDRLVVFDVDPAEIGGVVATLDGAGVEYDELAWSEPDLEDAYLELTGDAVGAVQGGAGRPAAVGGEQS